MAEATPSYQYPVFNAERPKEGPKAVGVSCDFSASTTFTANFLLSQAQQQMSMIQSVFVDNSLNAHDVDISVDVINQLLKVPPNSQGYFPLLAPKNTKLTLSSSGGVKVDFIFINVPMPAACWPTLNAFNP